ncbi:MAG: HAD hydrolase-like protein, partial [Bacteroidales bacterium]
MTFKGVVFDLDGTLIDSKADLAHAMNRVLLSEGFPIWPVEKYAFFVGKGIKNLVLNALPYNHRDDKTVMHCKEKIMTDYGS